MSAQRESAQLESEEELCPEVPGLWGEVECLALLLTLGQAFSEALRSLLLKGK